MFGVPPGISVLFSPATRRRLVVSMGGSLLVAGLEVVGVAALLPLLQLVTGVDKRSGALGWVWRHTGEPDDRRLALLIALVVFGAFVLKALVTVAFRWWMLGFISAQEGETAVLLLRRYLAAPYWMHLQRNSADLVRTMNDAVNQTYSLTVAGLIAAITEAATVAAIGLVLLVAEPVPALLALAYFALAWILFSRLVRRRAVRAGEHMQDASYGMYVSAFQALGGVKEITVRRSAAHFVERYAESRARYTRARRMSGFLTELPRYYLELVFIVGVTFLTVVVFAQNPTARAISTLALFVGAGFRMLPSLVRGLASAQMVRIGRKGVSLLVADLAEGAIPGSGRSDDPRAAPLAVRQGIEIRDVSFRYSPDAPDVLHHVSLSVPAGTSVALVGSSGAGKTTLVDVLLGLQTPAAGSILVDGVDIAEVLPSWQRALGLVPQDVYLLDDTLRANITFGERPEDADPGRLRSAVARAQIEAFVDSLPDGLDTVIGERGSRLSGGQRQRVGIARALYLEPAVLVLDEATSALDNETEQRITRTIECLSGSMTLVVVAHRLSTVRGCDRVVFLADGTVEATGSFEEVRAASPTFARLVELGTLEPATVPAEGGDGGG